RAAVAGPRRPAVEERGSTLSSDPALRERRGLDDAQDRARTLQQRNQRAKERIAADETLCPIDRVQHPGELATSFGGEFLAPDGMSGKDAANPAAHLLFDVPIHDRDRTAIALVLNLERCTEVLQGCAARHLGELLGE